MSIKVMTRGGKVLMSGDKVAVTKDDGKSCGPCCGGNNYFAYLLDFFVDPGGTVMSGFTDTACGTFTAISDQHYTVYVERHGLATSPGSITVATSGINLCFGCVNVSATTLGTVAHSRNFNSDPGVNGAFNVPLFGSGPTFAADGTVILMNDFDGVGLMFYAFVPTTGSLVNIPNQLTGCGQSVNVEGLYTAVSVGFGGTATITI